jgi:N-acetylneuraminic acid mutarotase
MKANLIEWMRGSRRRAVAAAWLLLATAGATHAIPLTVPYSARVSIDGEYRTGPGQVKFALVNATATQTYWSNDGSSWNGSEPQSSIEVNLDRGRFTVHLGDSSRPGMTELTPAALANEELYLAVWFSGDAETFERLQPDSRILPVFTALRAQYAETSFPEPAELPPGAVMSSASAADSRLLEAGYDVIGTSGGEPWTMAEEGSLPSARTGFSAVWAGSKWFVWGGNAVSQQGQSPAGDGAVYDADSRQWSLIPMDGQTPAARKGHSAVWTGTEMIVFGGSNTDYLAAAGRYSPSSNQWLPAATLGEPAARSGHAATWAGDAMLVWGGQNRDGLLNDGGLFYPGDGFEGSWQPLPTAGAPTARRDVQSVWTDDGWFLWGGYDGSYPENGALYDHSTQTWNAIAFIGLAGRRNATAVWTGTEVILFGGRNGSGALRDGVRYNPKTLGVRRISNAPQSFSGHTAVWTGSLMVVFGGDAGEVNAHCAIYDPAQDTWSVPSQSGGPVARTGHAAAWTGSRMLIFGGEDNSGSALAAAQRFFPFADLFLYRKR